MTTIILHIHLSCSLLALYKETGLRMVLTVHLTFCSVAILVWVSRSWSVCALLFPRSVVSKNFVLFSTSIRRGTNWFCETVRWTGRGRNRGRGQADTDRPSTLPGLVTFWLRGSITPNYRLHNATPFSTPIQIMRLLFTKYVDSTGEPTPDKWIHFFLLLLLLL